MPEAKITWHPENLLKKVEDASVKNLNKVGVYLQGVIVASFGSPAGMPEGWKRPAKVRKELFKAIRQVKAGMKAKARKKALKAKKAGRVMRTKLIAAQAKRMAKGEKEWWAGRGRYLNRLMRSEVKKGMRQVRKHGGR